MPVVGCLEGDPTDEDVCFARGYLRGVLLPLGWNRTDEVYGDRVKETWLKPDEEALIFLSYILYRCGVRRRP
jgi:hypothetical protein